MKTICSFFSLIILLTISVNAQVSQKYFGSPSMSAVAIRSAKLVGSSNRVIVGTKKSGTGDDDAFISCIDATNSVLWTKEIRTIQHDRFEAVAATSDGGCVAVGYVFQSLSSPYADNQASVYKFDAAGTVLWSRVFKATSYGEIFYSVIELPGTNDLVCGGLCDFGHNPGSSGIIVNLSSTGTTNWAKRYYMNIGTAEGNQIMDMVYHNGKVVCAGFFRGLSYYDGQIFAIKPNDGTVLWNRSFEYGSAFSGGKQTQWSDRIQIVNDTFYISAYLSGTWGSPNVTPTLLRLDSLGQNPLCLEYPITSVGWANVLHSRVVSSNEIYLFQHTAGGGWDRLVSNNPLSGITDMTCTKIKDMANPTSSMVYSRKLNTTGEQAIVDVEVSAGKIIGWGSAKNDPGVLVGTQDIFKLEADTSFPITATNCVANQTGQVFGNPTVTMNNSLVFSSINNITFTPATTPTVTTPSYSTANACAAAAPAVIVPDFSFVRSSCLGFNFTDLSTSSPTTIVAWLWSFGDGASSTIQHPSHSYASAGTYVVKLLVTDSDGNKDSISKTVNFSISRFANAGKDTLFCAPNGIGNIQLNASGGLSYLWSPATGLSDNSIANPIATVSGKQAYVVSVTDALGCIDKDTVVVEVKKGNVNVVAKPKNISGCIGSEAQLSATGAVFYQWIPAAGLSNDTIANPLLNISGIRQYIVIGKDSFGCTDRDTVDVIGFQRPNVKAFSDNAIAECGRQQVILNASGADSYQWSPATYCETGTLPSTRIISSFNTTIVFTVKGTDKNGCIGEDTITVFYKGKSIVQVPNTFTPNGDGINDKINPIIVCDFILSEFAIYNRWGERVFVSNSITQPWHGDFNGTACQMGVYYYYIKGKNNLGEDVLLKGDITLLR